jgi:hypothetical protein
MTLRRIALAALLALPAALPAGAALDPAVASRVQADMAAIRKADAARRAALLSRATATADLQRAFYEFRDQRRKASLDAAEALLAVRGSVPKEEWKTIVSELSAGSGLPSIVDVARKELPAAVADPARRAAAGKVLDELSAAFRKSSTDPEAARQKFYALLEKKGSTKEDFISAYEKLTDAQEKLDNQVLDGVANLRRTLTPEEWDELARRISPPSP